MRNAKRLSRFRDKGQKVYVPISARDNHYILAQFELPQSFIEKVKVIESKSEVEQLVYFISSKLIRLCNEYHVENLAIINKQKLVRVRFAQENETIETDEQLIFYYNPEQASGFRDFIDNDVEHYQFQLLFLSSGDEIRHNAVDFHQRIANLLKDFSMQCKLSENAIKIKDHQHITYHIKTQRSDDNRKAHGFRELSVRYQEQGFELPKRCNSQSYVIAKMPMSVLQNDLNTVDYFTTSPFHRIYKEVADIFKNTVATSLACQSAVVASDLLPIVRIAGDNKVQKLNELMLINLCPHGDSQCLVELDGTRYHDYIYFIFAANSDHEARGGYAKFVNNVTDVLNQITSKLGIENNRALYSLRFYQHLSYKQLP